MASLKSGEQKTEYNSFIFQWDIFRIQSDKIPVGLHGEGGNLNLSDSEP